jgi:hypothetical protein
MRVAKLCFLRPGHRISLIDCVHGCYVKKKVWMLEQLILAVQRACKNFLPGNRSKPGSIHIFPGTGKREPGTHLSLAGNLLYNTYETTKENSTSFPGAATERENTGLFICTGKARKSRSSLLFQWQQLV